MWKFIKIQVFRNGSKSTRPREELTCLRWQQWFFSHNAVVRNISKVSSFCWGVKRHGQFCHLPQKFLRYPCLPKAVFQQLGLADVCNMLANNGYGEWLCSRWEYYPLSLAKSLTPISFFRRHHSLNVFRTIKTALTTFC